MAATITGVASQVAIEMAARGDGANFEHTQRMPPFIMSPTEIDEGSSMDSHSEATEYAGGAASGVVGQVVTQHTSPPHQQGNDGDGRPTTDDSPVDFQAKQETSHDSVGGTPQQGDQGFGLLTQRAVRQSEEFLDDLVADLNNDATGHTGGRNASSDTGEDEEKAKEEVGGDNDDDVDELMNELYLAASRDSDAEEKTELPKDRKNKEPMGKTPVGPDGSDKGSSSEGDDDSTSGESGSESEKDDGDSSHSSEEKLASKSGGKHHEKKERKRSLRSGLRSNPGKTKKFRPDDDSPQWKREKLEDGKDHFQSFLFEEPVEEYDVVSMNRLRKKVRECHLDELKNAYMGGKAIFPALQTIGQDPSNPYHYTSFPTLHITIEQMSRCGEKWSAVKKFLAEEKVTTKATIPSLKYTEMVYDSKIKYAAGQHHHPGQGGKKGTKVKSSKGLNADFMNEGDAVGMAVAKTTGIDFTSKEDWTPRCYATKTSKMGLCLPRGTYHATPPSYTQWTLIKTRKQAHSWLQGMKIKPKEMYEKDFLSTVATNTFPVSLDAAPYRLVNTAPPNLAELDDQRGNFVCGLTSTVDRVKCKVKSHKNKACGADLKEGDVVWFNGTDTHLVYGCLYYVGVYKVVKGEPTCRVGVVKSLYNQVRYITNRVAMVKKIHHKDTAEGGKKEDWVSNAEGVAEVIYLDRGDLQMKRKRNY